MKQLFLFARDFLALTLTLAGAVGAIVVIAAAFGETI
jgi:hypothetical protein